jgi:hypothetical protein
MMPQMDHVERIEIMRPAEAGRVGGGGLLPRESIQDAAGRGCLKKAHW